MSGEWTAWFAAITGVWFFGMLFDRRERGEPIGYAVLVIVACLTATYWARGLQESGIYEVDPTFYAYTRLGVGIGFSTGIVATLIGQARAMVRPTLIGETGRMANAAETTNKQNATAVLLAAAIRKEDHNVSTDRVADETSRLADETRRIADAAEGSP